MSHPSQGPGNGPPSAGMGIQHQQGGQGPANSANNLSPQNLNQIVIEYLVKKGYNRTEQMLRVESVNLDKEGRPIHLRVEDMGNIKYARGLRMISDWIEQCLDIHKFELRRLLWPLFTYSYFDLVFNHDEVESERFFREFSPQFERVHGDELRIFETLKTGQQLRDNAIAQLYLTTKYRIPLNVNLSYNLLSHIDTKAKEGGSVIEYLLSTFCDLKTTERGPMSQFSFEALVGRAKERDADEAALQEGIDGAFNGVTNGDITDNNAILKLAMMPMEAELAQDVRADLEDEDAKNPPPPGKRTFVEEFDANVKREDSADGPTRNEIPLPPSRARDVVMEVQKIKEHRDRFRIDARSSGVSPGVSVCMFTFHNTLDSISCMEFSDDNNLVAVGTEDSYIRVWHLTGDPLPSIRASDANSPPTSSRRLIGHSATVYNVSFSPSIAAPEAADDSTPSTAPILLLSSSSDKTVRLWSLQTWACLVVYKGHDGPVWNVRWSPFGHYFATCGWDKTVRIWAQDHISYLRMMVGHDTSVCQIAWHPNGAYVFSASDHVDKTIRMWSFVTAECVRVFTGHTDFISAMECSPDGKILASADGGGNIFFWDLAKGQLIKRCKGHGKGGIWSLAFSVESTVLVSGGADGTVRVWDVEVPTDPHKADGEVIGTGGQADATRISATAGAQPGPAAAAGGKKKKKGKKDTTVTPDQISAFATKKTPVYKVKFTRMNLVLAGGCYLP